MRPRCVYTRTLLGSLLISILRVCLYVFAVLNLLFSPPSFSLFVSLSSFLCLFTPLSLSLSLSFVFSRTHTSSLSFFYIRQRVYISIRSRARFSVRCLICVLFRSPTPSRVPPCLSPFLFDVFPVSRRISPASKYNFNVASVS